MKKVLVALLLVFAASLTAQTYAGLSVEPYWIDATGGEVRTAAGGAVLAKIDYHKEKFYASGTAGWVNLVGDPDKFQAAQFAGAMGVDMGGFAVGGELGRL